MEINFTGKDKGKKNKSSRRQERVVGGYPAMVKKRKTEMANIEKNVNEVLKDYDGGMLAVIRIQEDENGKPDASHCYIGGVAGIDSQLKLGKALSSSADEVREMLIESAKENPDMIGSLLSGVLEGIIEEHSDKTECDHNH